MSKLHHAAICTTDVDRSMQFWREGLGFREMMDHEFEGDWPTLFGASTNQLRSVFLGDPDDSSGGIVELVVFDPIDPADDPSTGPRPGFFLLSVYCDLEATVVRLGELNLGGDPRRITVQGVGMATVRDPNGVLVELLDNVRR